MARTLVINVVSTLAVCIGIFAMSVALAIDVASAQEGTIDTKPLEIGIERVFSEVEIERPILVDHAGDGSGRLFIASQLGKVYVFSSPESKDEPKLFLDIAENVTYKDNENEEGFLGMTFHPQFKANGYFYVYYNATTEPHLTKLSRFNVSKDDPDKIDPSSEFVVMSIKKPVWNHNGGTIAFGPDGYLYLALGDGGSARDNLKTAQDITTVLGKILRIDVDHRDPGLNFAIPHDNPFANVAGARKEIYAFGLRNIWRFSFDRKTGEMYIADVGQDLYEEINLGKLGGNYGWSVREALHAFDESPRAKAVDRSTFIDPVFEYPHNETWGKSITGGNVYRGKKIEALDGYYLYGDYVTGKLWALKIDPNTKKAVANRPIPWQSALPIVTFGEDESGELYFTSTASGGLIYRFTNSARR